jgi:AFG3 family protein
MLTDVPTCAAGAQNDLERVTKMAYAQVGIYGMNKKVGLLSFPQDDNRFDKPYSNETARLIDDEARSLLDAAYARTVAIVSERRDLVQALADELLSKEVRLLCLSYCFAGARRPVGCLMTVVSGG